MNKVFVLFLFFLAICFAYCDLAVTEVESDDVDIGDVDIIIEDVRVNDALGDIIIWDGEIRDIVEEDVITLVCENDRDCNSERPYCVNKVCVVCRNNEDCKTGEICNEKNECEFFEKVCQKNTDCDMGYICKSGKCVEGCLTNKDCPPEDKPNSTICNTKSQNPVCVECLGDTDCIRIGLGTKCNEQNMCVEITCDPPCNEWEHCTNEGKCELNEGRCNNDRDCQLIDPSYICDLTTHTCKFKPQCAKNEDCNALCPECGGYCRNQKCDCITNCPKKGVCEQCADSSECEAGLECKGITGKFCQPQNCQNQQDCGGKYCLMGYCVCGI
ncbi:MAG: hypothetical protein N2746_03300 [Deltaproteobacteria bacterium]|nr:hypothetical protein [Deltaproteobacteria bacterium]